MLSPANVFLAIWFFALGTVVGSFLNVVIYRLPRGQSLVHPGSRCPQCERPIRWYDNVPIISWLVLRGHCRQCGSEIARRYPLVELLTGGVFLLLGVLEGIGRGSNLPRPENVTGMPWSTGELAILFTYHSILICGLVAAAWIVYDGFALPQRLISFMLGLGLSVPLLLPFVHPIGLTGQWHPPPSATGMLDNAAVSWPSSLAETATGLLAGATVGFIVSLICGVLRFFRTSPVAILAARMAAASHQTTDRGAGRAPERANKHVARKNKGPRRSSPQRPRSRNGVIRTGNVSSENVSPCHGVVSGGLWAGLFLGWQAVVAILPIALAIEIPMSVLSSTISTRPPDKRNEASGGSDTELAPTWPALGSFALATLIWLAAWRPIWSWLT